MNPNRPTWMWCQCKNKSKEWQASEINLSKYTVPPAILSPAPWIACGVSFSSSLPFTSSSPSFPLRTGTLGSVIFYTASFFHSLNPLWSLPIFNVLSLHHAPYHLPQCTTQLTISSPDDHIANQDGFLCCGNTCGLEYHLTARSEDDDIVIPFDFDFDNETEEAI